MVANMKSKYENIFNNYYVQLITVFVLALALILVSIVLFEDIDLDNIILIRNIFGTLAISGFLYSYDLSRRRFRNDLQMGLTRKKIYKTYLFQVFISLVVASFLVIYYMLIYRHVIRETFDIKEILSLPILFLILSFLGFFLGMFKMKKNYVYLIFSLLTISIVLIISYYSIAYFLDIIILTLVIILGVINYYLIMKKKI